MAKHVIINLHNYLIALHWNRTTILICAQKQCGCSFLLKKHHCNCQCKYRFIKRCRKCFFQAKSRGIKKLTGF